MMQKSEPITDCVEIGVEPGIDFALQIAIAVDSLHSSTLIRNDRYPSQRWRQWHQQQMWQLPLPPCSNDDNEAPALQ